MRRAPNLAYAIGLPPTDAIEYFRSLGYRVSRNAVQAYNAARAHAYTVTGITRMDVLQDVKLGIDKTLEQGTTLADFKRETHELLRRRGWLRTEGGTYADVDGEVVATLPPHRLQTIFRTNTQSAYMAGRYKQLLDQADIAPYWQYVAVMDDRTRPHHAALNGLIFRHDDPFWDSFFPPCGFNCRCSVRALRLRDIERRGLTISDSAGMLEDTEVILGKQTRPAIAFVDRATRQRVVADPGFGRRPIQTRPTIAQVLGNKLEAVDASIAAVVAQSQPGLVHSLAEDFVPWAQDILALGQAGNTYRVIAVFTPKIVMELRQRKLTPETSAVTLRDTELLHLNRDSKRGRGAALTREQILNLPALLQQARAVLWDIEDPALVYVLNIQGTRAEKAVVRIDWEGRVRDAAGRDKRRMNSLRTTGVAHLGNLKSARYKLIEGSLDD